VARGILLFALMLCIGQKNSHAQCAGIDFDCPNFDLIVDLAVDTAGNLNLCEGEPITFLNQTTAENLASIDSFVWIWNYLGNPGISQDCNIAVTTDPITHIYSFEDTVICQRPNQDYVILSVGLSAVDTNGCFSLVQSNEILVNIRPRALFNVTQRVCEGENIQFINQTCPVTSNISFFWESMPDGQTSTDFVPGFQYDDPGTYTVSLTVNTPICNFEDTYTLDIEVLPYPEPAYTILNPDSGDSLCAGLDTLIMVNLSTHTDSIRWDIIPAQDVVFLNNSQGSDTVYVMINTAGDYTIILNVLNSQCAKDTSFQFTVLETSFLDLDDLPECWDQPTIDLTDYVNINNGLPSDFTITVTYLQDGSVQIFNNVIPTNVDLPEIGLYLVEVSSNSSCGEVLRQGSLGYFPALVFQQPEILCGDQDTIVNLNDYLLTRPDLCLRWEGIGVMNDSLFNPSVVGDGFYDLTVFDCDTICIEETLQIIVVGPTIPIEDFSVCLLDDPISLDALLEGQWSGVPVRNDSLIPMLAGTGDYTLTYMTDVGAPCMVTDMVLVTIRDTVQADFSVNSPNCIDSMFQFVNLSGAPVITWYFGDGNTSTSPNPSYQYVSTGTYQVSLIAGEVNGGCQDSVSMEVVVEGLPDAVIGVLVDSAGCDSIDIALYALQGETSYYYEWDVNGEILFGDSVIATIAALDTAQEITVELQVTNTCGSVLISRPVQVPAGFHADIIYDSEEIKCPGELVDFINISNNVDSFIIDYGNGAVSVNQVLDTSFENNTDSTLYYDVIIYGFNELCGWDTGMVQVPIRPANVFASAIYDEGNVCEGEAVTFINNSSLQDLTIIYFGDGGSAIVGANDTIEYVYSTGGSFTPEVVAIGCGSDTNFLDVIQVYALPDFQIIITPGSPCIGEVVQLVNVGNTVSPTWTLGDDTLAQFTDTLLFVPDASGTYEIVLHAVSAGNNFCASTDTVSFVVGAEADLSVMVEPVIGCAPLEVDVQLSSTSIGASYFTDFGNQQVGTAANVSTIYSQDGLYNLNITVTNSDGCVKDSAITIEVLEEYEVEATGDTLILIGESVELDFVVNHPYENFTWSTGSEILGVNTVRPLEVFPLYDTNYEILVEGSASNCFDSDMLFVHVICDELFLPDAFSPNGDGINDTYAIYLVFDAYEENTRTSCLELIDWEIYDRWGERLFYADDFETEWDGSFRDDVLNVGIYTLLVRYNNSRGSEQIIRKEIHLLK